MGDIEIKKGPKFLLSVDQKTITSIKQTSDGIIFSFTNGIELINTDPLMPIPTKNHIEKKLPAISISSNTKLICDLLDYSHPVKIVIC